MNIIFKAVAGSHLFGLNTEKSDKDFRGVYLPSKEDILLNRVQKSVNESTYSAVGFSCIPNKRSKMKLTTFKEVLDEFWTEIEAIHNAWEAIDETHLTDEQLEAEMKRFRKIQRLRYKLNKSNKLKPGPKDGE